MSSFRALAVAVLVLVLPTPSSAAPQSRCLTADQQRAAIASGQAMRLGTVLRALHRRSAGDVVRAQLCRQGNRLVYVLTVLARNGKVTRLTIDATNGSAVGRY